MYALLLSLLLGGETPAMRCGDLLVVPGANMLEVLARCGAPAWRERISAADEPVREAWIYEWPQNGAQKLLYFEGVTLARIHSADLVGATTAGSEGLRCGNALIRPGDTKLSVKRRCGEPALAETVSGEAGVQREVWLYAHGDGSMELHFNEVRLERIERRPR